MKISLFSSHWKTLGGGEQYLATLAECLYNFGHEVNLVGVDKSLLESRFKMNLSGIGEGKLGGDVAFITSNVRPYGLPADKNIYIIQIPYSKLRFTPKDMARRALLANAKYADDVWVYSRFVAEHLSDFGIKAHIIHPTYVSIEPGYKEKIILSVGRIFRNGYNDKHYPELIDAFREVHRKHPKWKYFISGGCNDTEYLAELRTLASDVPVSFYPNPAREFLENLYGCASIFWHGAGYKETRPENMEHFGISTLEAMSAGCVPIVFNGGGQKEIVIPGTGILWTELDELVNMTVDVINHSRSFFGLAVKATYRSEDFNRMSFNVSVMYRLKALGIE